MANWPRLDLRMVTMNMGTAGAKKDDGNARIELTIRQERIAKYWKSVNPDIVFAQDIGDDYDQDRWSLAVEDHYTVSNADKKVGIAYNSKVFKTCVVITGEKKETIAAALSEDFADTGRLWAVVLYHKRTDLRLLCVSWHGRFKKVQPGGGRTGAMENVVKRKRLTTMLTFVQAMADCGYKDDYGAIVAAGDFNVKQSRLAKYGDFKECTDTNNVKYDYFLYKGLQDKPKCFEGEYTPNPKGEKGYLDHKPICADIRLPCVICYKDFDPPCLLDLYIHKDCLQKWSLGSGQVVDQCPACKQDFRLPAGGNKAELRRTKLQLMSTAELIAGDVPEPHVGRTVCTVWIKHLIELIQTLDTEAIKKENEMLELHTCLDTQTELENEMSKLNVNETNEESQCTGKLDLIKRLGEITLCLAHMKLLKAISREVQQGDSMRELSHVIAAVETFVSGSWNISDIVTRTLLCGFTESIAEGATSGGTPGSSAASSSASASGSTATCGFNTTSGSDAASGSIAISGSDAASSSIATSDSAATSGSNKASGSDAISRPTVGFAADATSGSAVTSGSDATSGSGSASTPSGAPSSE